MCFCQQYGNTSKDVKKRKNFTKMLFLENRKEVLSVWKSWMVYRKKHVPLKKSFISTGQLWVGQYTKLQRVLPPFHENSNAKHAISVIGLNHFLLPPPCRPLQTKSPPSKIWAHCLPAICSPGGAGVSPSFTQDALSSSQSNYRATRS